MAVPKRKKSKAWRRHKININCNLILKKLILKNFKGVFKSNVDDLFLI
jgi:ribosomal protein L32